MTADVGPPAKDPRTAGASSRPGATPVDAVRVLDQLGDAVVVADAAGTILMVNHACSRLFGYEVGDLVGHSVLTLIPPRLQEAHLAGFTRFAETRRSAVVGGSPMRVAARRADGSEVPVGLTLSQLGTGSEAGLVVVAALRDVSERVALEREAVLSRLLQASVDASRDGVLAVSPDRRVLAINRRFCELWRLPPGSIQVGDTSPALGAGSLSQVVDPDAFESAIGWGHAHPDQVQTLDVGLVDGRVLEGYAAPVIDEQGVYHGRVWYLRDDTERRSAEARLASAERAERFLLDASAVIARASGYEDTLSSLAAAAVPALGDLCVIDVVDERGEVARMATVHGDPRLQPLAEQLAHFPPDRGGQHPSAQAIRDGRSRYSPTLTEEFLGAATRDEAHLEILRKLRFTSYMTVPLIAEGQVLGALAIMSAGSGRRFGPDDLKLVEDLASRAATVVAKERRNDSQRSLAHSLQASLLPSDPPAVPGLELAVRYLPGTGDVEVGGDFWDVSVLADGSVALAVGDVEGHDMTAAATMAQLRSAIRALRTCASGPEHLLELIGQAWEQLGLERMATVCLGQLDVDTGLLCVASAGHPPPLLVGTGSGRYLPVQPAAALGAPPTTVPACELVWPVGAAVIFFTDGLVEDPRTPIETGLDRLLEAAVAAPDLTPESLADHILTVVGGQPRHDDAALLVVRRSGPGRRPPL